MFMSAFAIEDFDFIFYLFFFIYIHNLSCEMECCIIVGQLGIVTEILYISQILSL